MRCIPRTNSIFLDQPPAIAGIEKKLLEFSAAFASAGDAAAAHALSADEVATLKLLLETLGLRDAAHTPAQYVRSDGLSQRAATVSADIDWLSTWAQWRQGMGCEMNLAA